MIAVDEITPHRAQKRYSEKSIIHPTPNALTSIVYMPVFSGTVGFEGIAKTD